MGLKLSTFVVVKLGKSGSSGSVLILVSDESFVDAVSADDGSGKGKLHF